MCVNIMSNLDLSYLEAIFGLSEKLKYCIDLITIPEHFDFEAFCSYMHRHCC